MKSLDKIESLKTLRADLIIEKKRLSSMLQGHSHMSQILGQAIKDLEKQIQDAINKSLTD